MKLTRNLKKHLLPVCLVLAFALLALFSGVSVYGRRLVELVSFDIP